MEVQLRTWAPGLPVLFKLLAGAQGVDRWIRVLLRPD